jgi:hypothetical protein
MSDPIAILQCSLMQSVVFIRIRIRIASSRRRRFCRRPSRPNVSQKRGIE